MRAVLQERVWPGKPHQEGDNRAGSEAIQETPGHGRRAVRGGNTGIGLRKPDRISGARHAKGGNHGIPSRK